MIASEEIFLELSEAQEEVHQAAWDDQIFQTILFGGVRSAKTDIASLLTIEQLEGYDGENYIILGQTHSSAKRNVLPALKKYCQLFGIPGCNWKSNPAQVLGNDLHFLGSGDTTSLDRMFGIGACGAHIDEGTRIPQEAVKTCVDRCDKPGARIVMTMNPASPVHWIKKELIDKSLGDVYTRLMNPDENPFLPPGYLERIKRQRTGAQYQRLIDGLWVPLAGTIYPDYFTTSEDPSNLTQLDISVDPGSRDPYAGLIIGDMGNGRYIVLDEYHSEDSFMTAKAHCQEMTVKVMGWVNTMRTGLGWCMVDPSARAHRNEYTNANYPVTQVDNVLYDGIVGLQQALGAGWYIIHDRCENLLNELSLYVWDEKKSDEPVDEFNHLLDALRYHCNRAFPIGRSFEWL